MFAGFGAPAPAPAPAGGLSFGFPTSAGTAGSTGAVAGSAPAFAGLFGATTAAPAPAIGTTGFTFAAPAPAAATTATTGFGFGLPSIATSAAAPAPATAGFSFGMAAPAPAATGFAGFGGDLFGKTNMAATQQALAAPAGLTPSTLVSALPDHLKKAVLAIQAHLDAEKQAAGELGGQSTSRLSVLGAETAEVQQAFETLEVFQAKQCDAVAVLSNVINNDQAHLETAANNVRLAPAGYVREVTLPSPFLTDFVSESEGKLGLLRARIRELAAAVAATLDASGQAAPAAVTTDVLKQVISGEYAAFMRLAGGKVAPLHDLVEDLRRDVLDVLRAELNLYLSENPIEPSTLQSARGVGSSTSVHTLLSQAIDPFAAEDAREKRAAEKRAKARLDALPKPVQPQLALPQAPAVAAAQPSAFGWPTAAATTAAAPAATTTNFFGALTTPAPAPAPAVGFGTGFAGFGTPAPAPASAFSGFPATGVTPAPNKTVTFGAITPAPAFPAFGATGFATPAAPMHTPALKRSSGKKKH